MRAFTRGARLVVASIVLVFAACRQDDNTLAGPKRFSPKAQRDAVPAEAPDEELTSTTIVTNPAEITGSFIQDVIDLRFAAGTNQVDRQTAVNAVGGTVFGGMPFDDGGEGIYYVQLPVIADEQCELAVRGLEGGRA